MQTLRSILSILLIALFIPSPAVLANAVSVSAAMQARNAAAGTAGGSASGGGGSSSGGSPGAGAHAAAQAQAAQQRSLTSMAAIKRMQEAARLHSGAIADPNRPGHYLPNVPDGLGQGGLQVSDRIGLDPSLWQGAKLPSQSVDNGKTVVTVEQEAAQALLTWKSFNVGKDTILNFDQSAGGADRGNWVAFNQIEAGSAISPSQILGQLRADGQVYVINPNGIIFGHNSQVDVRSLTVSSLPINRNLVEGGLLNNPNAQFLFSAQLANAAQNEALGFTPEPPPAQLGRYGDVLVLAGAQLRSTQGEDGNGGRIMLVGPNVQNHGTISTPGGQTILAAGLQVGVAAHSGSASLRGLDVYVGAMDANSGHALNAGLIESMLGNTTIAGRTVEVTGGIDSGTSVALNGRIDLIAAYGAKSNVLSVGGSNYVPFLNEQSGTVLIGADSVLRILPQLQSTDKVAASELALRSELNITGKDIYFGERSTILVPSGNINVNAGVWKVWNPSAGSRVAQLINADGQIYLDKDVLISAAGTTDVHIPLSQVLLTVELRGPELADSPVQRDDILRGQTITVDIRKRGTLNGVDWVGSPLADVSGYLGLVERTVAELTMAGGDVNLNAGGSIVMQEGSKIDVSGGFARYEEGIVRTTALIKDGRLINIADALPDVKYDAVYKDTITSESPRWGKGDSYTKHLSQGGNSYEGAYTEGAAGGSLALTASAMALDGALRGSTVTGERQRTNLPEHASLTLAFQTHDLAYPKNGSYPVIAPNAPDVAFVNGSQPAAAAGAFVAGGGITLLPQERVQSVALSGDLLGPEGFGNVTVRNRGADITIGTGVAIQGQTGGALVLEGANVTVDGAVSIAGGKIDLSAYTISYETINALNIDPDSAQNPPAQEGRGVVTVGGVLSTAGQVIEDVEERVGTVQDTYAIDGGSISLRGFQTNLTKDSVIDVSGGVHLGLDGRLTYGDGGAIVLEGGRDPFVNSVLEGSPNPDGEIEYKGLLAMNGTLKGFSGGRGGSLSLLAPVVEIGTVRNSSAEALVLNSGFFNKGGFADFDIRGIGAKIDGTNERFVSGVTIGSDADIRPQAQSLIAVRTAEGLDLELDQSPYREGVRAAGSLSFGAVGADDTYGKQLLVRGEVTMEEGSRIETDAGGSVAFDANAIALHGTVITPGGSITVKGGNSYGLVDTEAQQALATVYLGQNANLSAKGKTVYFYNAQGLNPGKVYAGGTISLHGNIVAEAGAQLDVSGTSGVIDLPNRYNPVGQGTSGRGNNHGYTSVRADSAGGTIRLVGGQMLVSDATLIGNAGGDEAVGGTLEVSSGRFYAPNTNITTTADINLSVVQGGGLLDGSQRGTGMGATGADGSTAMSGGHFAVDSFTQGGFNNLTLGGNVRVEESVRIEADGTVALAKGGVLQSSDHSVHIKAGHVAIGQDFRPPANPADPNHAFTKNEEGAAPNAEHNFAPQVGTGELKIEAGSIDIGTLVLHGIKDATFTASNEGSIRGNGSFNMAGDLTLKAGQIHPTTATEFNISAFDYTVEDVNHQGSITFDVGNANLALPYSAGGTLGAYASQIEQKGVLLAPFGVINLGWDGTGTAPRNAVTGGSVPVSSNVTLAAGSVTSVSGVGPDGKGITLPYGVLLNGVSWIDPRGIDITLSGPPEKKVSLSAKDIITEENSLIDMRGGGDLLAYRWVPGVGGSRDILSLPGSFAVIPDYKGVAPSAPYNPTPIENTLNGDKGYTDASLKVGDRIYLSGQSGLAAGYYTLLPARYALLEGAYLVTPKKDTPVGTNVSIAQADGSQLVSGYRVDGVSGTPQNGKVLSLFEVAGRDVVMARAQYELYSANEFMAAAAKDRDMTAPRLPGDSGQLVFTAAERMQLGGGLQANPVGDGRGSLVDINSALDIVIGSGAQTGTGEALHLSAQTLSEFAAASLLIGGVRNLNGGDIVVRASSSNVTLDNAGSPLSGTDIILVGKDSVRLAEGAELVGTGNGGSAGTIRLGHVGTEENGSDSVSGDGALVRVSSDTNARIERVNVTGSEVPTLIVERGAQVSGGSVTLDSSAKTQMDAQAQLHADSLNLGSGKISLVLDEGASLGTDSGLVLSGAVLDSILDSVGELGLSSYSTIDVYGAGAIGSDSVESLVLNTPSLRAFATDGGEVQFIASNLLLQNTTDTVAEIDNLPADGSIVFRTDHLELGKGVIRVEGFERTDLIANKAIRVGKGGSINAAHDMRVISPLISGVTGADYKLLAGGDFSYGRGSAGSAANTDLGVGASLAIEAESVALGSDIVLPSGKLDIRARSGDVTLEAAEGMTLDVSASSRFVYDRKTVADAGQVKLRADLGNVVVEQGATVDVSDAGDGSVAGSLGISAAKGAFVLRGTLDGGSSGDAALNLDALHLADAQGNTTESLAQLDAALNEGGFGGQRSYRLRSGDVLVDGVARAHNYAVSADAGSVRVTGTVDASGHNGGQIELRAADDVVLENGAVLSVAAAQFNTAGKGGKVFLEAGSQIDGEVNHAARVGIREGSLIDLSVASKVAESLALGMHSGVLHLRAAQNASASDLGIDVIEGEVRGASHIVAEGYRLYDRTATNGKIDTALQTQIRQDGTQFLGAAGTSTAQYEAMLERLSGGDAALREQIILQAGAEIINRNGDLILGDPSTGTAGAWDFSTYRFGARSAAGVLTLRASGDIGIYDALTDGFTPATTSGLNATERLWLAPLMAQNALLPTNAQSWSYRIAAGADTAAADYRSVLDADQLAGGKGSLLLGRNATNASGGTNNATTKVAINNRFQVIRTGSGDIDVLSARDIRFLNPFASIYTAGTRLADFTRVEQAGDFSLPIATPTVALFYTNNLGAVQQNYLPSTSPAQYSISGGDVSLYAAGDMGRYTRLSEGGDLVIDSSRQMPTNWLYRRGYVDSASGQYGSFRLAPESGGLRVLSDPAASTTWWVDFSNFFQSVGALGGGNVSLAAGRDIINVDAVVPTNARAPRGLADASRIVELGGGDLRVQAGRNIDGGVYYVERGQGSLNAGNSVTTNEARSISLGFVRNPNAPEKALPAETWMPTTLFLGKGGFDVSATGDVLLGPVANVFLMPQGFINGYWYKTYFSTYGAQSAVRASSVTGDVTLRNQVTLPDSTSQLSFLEAWFGRQNLLRTENASNFQPWLRLAESSVTPFATLFTAMPPSLRLTSYSGDVNLAGDFNLWPSQTGALELLAAGNLHALSPNGISNTIDNGAKGVAWNTSRINLSDANPNALPGIANPFSYTGLVGSVLNTNAGTMARFLQDVNRFFDETGSVNTGLQRKQDLHAAQLLHRNDPDPVYLYAGGGDISGLTLYSAKPAQIIAARDITDIAFYLQNLNASQTSLVVAGRDIVAYNNNSERRRLAQSAGNGFNVGTSASDTTLGGDIQLGGPGTLQVLAGRNLDLGIGSAGRNGLSAGVTTIGNRRNPFLPETGAQIIAGAGIGASTGLVGSDLDFPAFIDAFLNPESDGELSGRYLKALGDLLRPEINSVVWADFSALDSESQQALVLEVYRSAKANGDIDPSAPDTPASIAAFVRDFLNPVSGGEYAQRYLVKVQELMGISDTALAWEMFSAFDAGRQAPLALNIFYTVLRDAGRDYNNPDSETFGRYDNGYAAIKALFPETAQTPEEIANLLATAGEEEPSRWAGNITLTSRQFKTAAGGDISLFAPGGGLVVGFPVAGAKEDQGILTEGGGNINIFTRDSVEVGSSRIFTLRGGNIAIWSSTGDIAAGSAARTVRSAPPNRVIIDTQTGSVLTDLSGLATGGGIGALQTVRGAKASDIDLIAPEGAVDAGDAGIRVSGNVNVAAVEVINAGNIASSGSSAGVPSTAVALPNVGSLTAANSAAQAATSGMGSGMGGGSRDVLGDSVVPSVISIEVLGYGEEDDDKRVQAAPHNGQQSASLSRTGSVSPDSESPPLG